MAIFAILIATLMPAVSHLLRASGSAAWVEVCTSLGSKWVSAVDAEKTGTELPRAMLDDCPYCLLQGNLFGLPPRTATAAPLLLARFDVPRLFLAAARTPFVWLSAQPRAPPQVS